MLFTSALSKNLPIVSLLILMACFWHFIICVFSSHLLYNRWKNGMNQSFSVSFCEMSLCCTSVKSISLMLLCNLFTCFLCVILLLLLLFLWVFVAMFRCCYCCIRCVYIDVISLCFTLPVVAGSSSVSTFSGRYALKYYLCCFVICLLVLYGILLLLLIHCNCVLWISMLVILSHASHYVIRCAVSLLFQLINYLFRFFLITAFHQFYVSLYVFLEPSYFAHICTFGIMRCGNSTEVCHTSFFDI